MDANRSNCDAALEQSYESLRQKLVSTAERSLLLEGYSNLWRKVWSRMDLLPLVTEERTTNDTFEIIRADLDEKRPARILDVQAGAGGLGFRFAREFLESEVTLSDSHTSAYELMNYIMSECGLSNARLDTSDPRRLSFGDDSFDAVLLNLVLERSEHPDDIIGEAVRVLKPGGFLYVVRARRNSFLRMLVSVLGALSNQQKCLHLGQRPRRLLSENLLLNHRFSRRCAPAFWLLTVDSERVMLKKIGRAMRVIGKRLDTRFAGAFSRNLGGIEISAYEKGHE